MYESWSVERIALSLSKINTQLAAFLETLEFQLPRTDMRCPHLIGAGLPASYHGNFVGALRAKNIFISQRGNAIRFAPHLHIDAEDIARLFQAIEDVVRQGRR
jgi:hypothetical protein